jgi:hypothetical protein
VAPADQSCECASNPAARRPPLLRHGAAVHHEAEVVARAGRCNLNPRSSNWDVLAGPGRATRVGELRDRGDGAKTERDTQHDSKLDAQCASLDQFIAGGGHSDTVTGPGQPRSVPTGPQAVNERAAHQDPDDHCDLDPVTLVHEVGANRAEPLGSCCSLIVGGGPRGSCSTSFAGQGYINPPGGSLLGLSSSVEVGLYYVAVHRIPSMMASWRTAV